MMQGSYVGAVALVTLLLLPPRAPHDHSETGNRLPGVERHASLYLILFASDLGAVLIVFSLCNFAASRSLYLVA